MTEHIAMIHRMIGEQRKGKPPIKAAQHTVCTVQAGLQLLREEIKATSAAHPEGVKCATWSEQIDDCDVLLDGIGTHEEKMALWDRETKRLLDAWKEEGSSERLAEAMAPLHETEKEAKRLLDMAEKDLLKLCQGSLPIEHRQIETMFADAIAGNLYRGIPSHPSPYDKLVDLCLRWDGIAPDGR